MQLKQYKIHTLNFTSNNAEIQKLLPKQPEYKIEIELIANSKIANAIRRTACSELPTIAMYVDIKNIDTNRKHIIKDEIKTRIQLLPVMQPGYDNLYKTPVSENLTNFDFQLMTNIQSKNKSKEQTEPKSNDQKSNDQQDQDQIILELNYYNNTDQPAIVYSDQIKPSGWVLPGFRIAKLDPGEHITIKPIKLIIGMGKHHAMFTGTSDFCYDCLDYKMIRIINNKGIRDYRVSVQDLKFLKLSPKEIQTSKILLKTKNMENLLSDWEKQKIKKHKYDIIKQVNSYPAECFSINSDPKHFYLSFIVAQNYKPEKFIPDCVSNLLTRFNKIITGLKNWKNNQEDSTGVIDLIKNTENRYSIIIVEESHTVAELVVYYAVKADPNIKLIKKRMSHPEEDRVFIDIVHTQPLAFCISVCDKIKSDLEQLQTQLSKQKINY